MSAIFDMTVPVYIRGLEQLSYILQVGERWTDEHNMSHETLLEANLAPDMKALPFQVWSACNTAKSVAPRVAQIPSPIMEDNQTTLPELHNRTQRTIDFLRSLKPEDFEGKEDGEVVLQFSRTLRFPTSTQYLQVYGVSNFWFHVTTAYCILRNKGVPLSKVDFIGPV